MFKLGKPIPGELSMNDSTALTCNSVKSAHRCHGPTVKWVDRFNLERKNLGVHSLSRGRGVSGTGASLAIGGRFHSLGF